MHYQFCYQDSVYQTLLNHINTQWLYSYGIKRFIKKDLKLLKGDYPLNHSFWVKGQKLLYLFSMAGVLELNNQVTFCCPMTASDRSKWRQRSLWMYAGFALAGSESNVGKSVGFCACSNSIQMFIAFLFVVTRRISLQVSGVCVCVCVCVIEQDKSTSYSFQ